MLHDKSAKDVNTAGFNQNITLQGTGAFNESLGKSAEKPELEAKCDRENTETFINRTSPKLMRSSESPLKVLIKCTKDKIRCSSVSITASSGGWCSSRITEWLAEWWPRVLERHLGKEERKPWKCKGPSAHRHPLNLIQVSNQVSG